MRPKKEVKLKDIADELGISVVTVSNALSGKSGVSEELRSRILEKSHELGYVYKPKKSSEKKTDAVFAFLMKDSRESAAEVHELMKRAAAAEGCSILPVQMTPELEHMGTLKTRNISGLILCGNGWGSASGTRDREPASAWPAEELLRIRNRCSLPIVGLGFADLCVDLDYVVSDAFHAAYQRTQKLLQEGIREVAVMSASSGDPVEMGTPGRIDSLEKDRIYGCQEAFFYFAGKPLEERPCIIPDREALIRRIRDNKGTKDLPGAILCLDSSMVPAVAAIPEVQESGIIVADCGRPDPGAMAREAMEVLLSRIHGKDTPEGVHYVGEKL